MALMAPVENGKIVETESQNSLKNTSKTSNSGMDKDAFLQLLVAQMKYQDPLEPTSNTEFISQYAQFSQVENFQPLPQDHCPPVQSRALSPSPHLRHAKTDD